MCAACCGLVGLLVGCASAACCVVVWLLFGRRAVWCCARCGCWVVAAAPGVAVRWWLRVAVGCGGCVWWWCRWLCACWSSRLWVLRLVVLCGGVAAVRCRAVLCCALGRWWVVAAVPRVVFGVGLRLCGRCCAGWVDGVGVGVGLGGMHVCGHAKCNPIRCNPECKCNGNPGNGTVDSARKSAARDMAGSVKHSPPLPARSNRRRTSLPKDQLLHNHGSPPQVPSLKIATSVSIQAFSQSQLK